MFHSAHHLKYARTGELRPIATSYLTAILEFLLNALVANSLSHQGAPAEDLVWTLEQEHEVKADVTRQVMAWFGEISAGLWKVDVEATVKEVGLGILRAYRVCAELHRARVADRNISCQHDQISEGELLKKWRAAVGDTFESSVDLKLLLVRSPFPRPV